MIQIIKAEETHIPDIGRLWLEFMRFHADIEPIFEAAEGAEIGFQEEHVKKYIESEDRLALMAMEDGNAVGYSFAEIKTSPEGMKRGTYGYIDTVAVTADYRRSGVGERLYSAVLDWFRDKGISRVELEITSRNQVSASFWDKQGFTEYMRKLYRQI